MITRVLQSLREAAWHPSDEQLVAFIDAELRPRETGRVRRHLARCWACRGRERKLAETIGAFMDAYASESSEEDDDALLPHPARLPHAALAALRERTPPPFTRMLQRLRAGVTETARAVAGRARHPYVSPAAIARVAAACATALIIVLLSTGEPLSARQVVQQADRAERGVLAATPAPVIYQRLDIAVRQLPGGATTRGTFDLWTDVERHRHHHDRRHAALADLLALFSRHGLSSAWPVSLRSYEQMRAAVADAAAEERVLREEAADGERRLTLETLGVGRSGRTIDTRLVVRERDWHPIEQRLTVRDGIETTEFVVRETGFQVIPLATLPVAFFDARPSGLAADNAAAATRVETPRAPAARRPALPTVSELVSAEVQAMFALHRVGMTAEDDIAVERRESIVEISGLTTSAARRSQLTDAIARIKHVRVRIRTTDEALSALSALALRMDETAIDATRLPVHAPAKQTEPASRPADEASMRRAREAVRQSLTLLERAWALRRLAEWSRRTNASAVTASTRDLIDLMVREHAEAASKALATLDTTVTPTLPASSRNADGTPVQDDRTAPVEPARAWVDVATDFFGVAAEIDRDTRRLFTASPTPTTEAADEARRLRHGLDRAARSLLELRQPAAQPQP